MTLREEIKKKRDAYFETATTKQKLSYLIQYYGIRAVLICTIICFIGSWIYHLITDPEIILNGTFVNYNLYNTTLDVNVLEKDFLSVQNINESEYEADFRTNIVIIESEEANDRPSLQSLDTQIASGVLDFAIADIEILESYAYGYHFVDLTTVLSKEQIDYFKPYFLYVDLDVMAQRQEKHEDIPIPDMRNPEIMKNPIPVLIDISNCPIIQEIYGEKSTDII